MNGYVRAELLKTKLIGKAPPVMKKSMYREKFVV